MLISSRQDAAGSFGVFVSGLNDDVVEARKGVRGRDKPDLAASAEVVQLLQSAIFYATGSRPSLRRLVEEGSIPVSASNDSSSSSAAVAYLLARISGKVDALAPSEDADAAASGGLLPSRVYRQEKKKEKSTTAAAAAAAARRPRVAPLAAAVARNDDGRGVVATATPRGVIDFPEAARAKGGNDEMFVKSVLEAEGEFSESETEAESVLELEAILAELPGDRDTHLPLVLTLLAGSVSKSAGRMGISTVSDLVARCLDKPDLVPSPVSKDLAFAVVHALLVLNNQRLLLSAMHILSAPVVCSLALRRGRGGAAFIEDAEDTSRLRVLHLAGTLGSEPYADL